MGRCGPVDGILEFEWWLSALLVDADHRMKVVMKHLLALLAVMAFMGCLTEPVDTQLDGNYVVVARRGDGSIETKGTMALRTLQDEAIRGTWELEDVDGDGELAGRFHEGEVSVDLHPGWRDHNLILVGRLKQGVINGTWQWIGFAGVMSEGTFEAKKLR